MYVLAFHPRRYTGRPTEMPNQSFEDDYRQEVDLLKVEADRNFRILQLAI
jgi:hypothetical protein